MSGVPAEFTYGADGSSRYYIDPNPRPAATTKVPFYAMSDRLRSVYFGLGLATSIMAITVSAGQMFTKTQCRAYKNSKDETNARYFEIIAGVTIALSIVLLGFSLYALITSMGKGHGLAKAKSERAESQSDLFNYHEMKWTSLHGV